MTDWQERTRMLVGDEALGRLAAARVAIFGLGGVGSAAIEALARAGVGHFILVDVDTFSESNLNRQLLATRSTLGRPKVDVAAERIHDINPDATIQTHQTFFNADTADDLLSAAPDVLIDAIDGIASKITLLTSCLDRDIPVVSVLGTGRRLDPTSITITRLDKTKDDPLALRLRKRFRRRGRANDMKRIPVVCSTDLPQGPTTSAPPEPGPGHGRPRVPLGSFPTVPPTAGFTAAWKAIEILLKA